MSSGWVTEAPTRKSWVVEGEEVNEKRSTERLFGLVLAGR